MSKSIEELRADLAAAEAEAQKAVEETPAVTIIPDPVAGIASASPVDPETIKAAQEAFDNNPPPVVTLDPPAVPAQPPCDNDHVAEGCEKFPDGFVEAKPEEGWDVPDAPMGVSGLDAPTPGVVASFTDVSLSESDTARLKERGEFSGVKVQEPIGPLGLLPVDPSRDFLETAREQDDRLIAHFKDQMANRKDFAETARDRVVFQNPPPPNIDEGNARLRADAELFERLKARYAQADLEMDRVKHGPERGPFPILPEVAPDGQVYRKLPLFTDELRYFLYRWFHEDTAKFLFNQISTSHHVARLNTPQ